MHNAKENVKVNFRNKVIPNEVNWRQAENRSTNSDTFATHLIRNTKNLKDSYSVVTPKNIIHNYRNNKNIPGYHANNYREISKNNTNTGKQLYNVRNNVGMLSNKTKFKALEYRQMQSDLETVKKQDDKAVNTTSDQHKVYNNNNPSSSKTKYNIDSKQDKLYRPGYPMELKEMLNKKTQIYKDPFSYHSSANNNNTNPGYTQNDQMYANYFPNVWALPNNNFVSPNVYLDKNYLKNLPTNQDFEYKPMLNVGPFGVGEAKACLDDLNAHLLSYYGKLFAAEETLPIDYILDQLQASYYPSPYPISDQEPSMVNGVNLAQHAGSLPPNKIPLSEISANAINGENNGVLAEKAAKLKIKNSMIKSPLPTKDEDKSNKIESEESIVPHPIPAIVQNINEEKVSQNAIPTGASYPSVLQDVTTVISELFDLADGNSKKIDGLLTSLYDDIYDPTSSKYFRNNQSGNIKAPKYVSNGPYRKHLYELEDTLETMYKNLRIAAEWNARKIQLMQDRLKILRQPEDPRICK